VAFNNGIMLYMDNNTSQRSKGIEGKIPRSRRFNPLLPISGAKMKNKQREY
jgi:hypothetical protein